MSRSRIQPLSTVHGETANWASVPTVIRYTSAAWGPSRPAATNTSIRPVRAGHRTRTLIALAAGSALSVPRDGRYLGATAPRSQWQRDVDRRFRALRAAGRQADTRGRGRNPPARRPQAQ